MSGELSEGQKALVRELAGERIEEILRERKFLKEDLLARPEKPEDDVKIPDLERTKHLAGEVARQAIADWEKAKPAWWNVRRRAETALAGAGLAGLIILFAIDYAWDSRTLVADGIHWLAGTEDLIDASFVKTIKNWESGTRTDATMALNQAFAERIDAWAAGKEFKTKSRGALEELVSSSTGPDNPLRSFVKEALEENPLLMFQAQGALGSELPVEVNDAGCTRLFVHWFENQKQILPEKIANMDPKSGLQDACQTIAKVRLTPSIEVPFFARFHEDEDGIRDRVLVVLHVRRFSRKEGNGETQDHFDVSPKDGSIDGLSIQYNSTNTQLISEGRDTVDLSSTDLRALGNNFFGGFIDKKVTDATYPPSTGRPMNHELIHSISVSLPDGEAVPELVQVRAMVMVNKEKF